MVRLLLRGEASGVVGGQDALEQRDEGFLLRRGKRLEERCDRRATGRSWSMSAWGIPR